MSEAEVVAMVWSWATPIAGFIGFVAVCLLGFSLLREITR